MARVNGGELNLRTDHVLVKVKKGTGESLKALALDIEGRAKVIVQQNGQIDTGFMLNTGYSGWEGGNNHGTIWPSGAYTSAKQGATVQRDAAGPETVNQGAFVHFAALYAIWQELKRSFLYRAAAETKPKPIVERVFREELHD